MIPQISSCKMPNALLPPFLPRKRKAHCTLAQSAKLASEELSQLGYKSRFVRALTLKPAGVIVDVYPRRIEKIRNLLFGITLRKSMHRIPGLYKIPISYVYFFIMITVTLTPLMNLPLCSPAINRSETSHSITYVTSLASLICCVCGVGDVCTY
ncbi:hypothetical protein BJV82DRAFT_620906 [Fennellomyces sp. T-0311]|nr:hypothetical protein BJV82DRAFT_620906 [Fennellomyces sp. T-0311]